MRSRRWRDGARLDRILRAVRYHGAGQAMRRRIIIVVIFLLAGAVVNVAVAWGCSWFGSLPPVASQPDLEVIRDWPRAVPDDWPSWPTSVLDIASVGNTFTVTCKVSDRRCHLVVHQTGLPLRSIESHVLSTFWPDFQRFEHTHVATWQTGTFVGTLPLRPIWLGFIGNTLFYAGLLCLPFVVRRFVRVRRGLCPKCVYPIGESAVCSECGKALPKRATVIADG